MARAMNAMHAIAGPHDCLSADVFLAPSTPEIVNFVAGVWRDVVPVEGPGLHDPNTGRQLRGSVNSTNEQWEEVLSWADRQARRPFRTSRDDRLRALREIADALDARATEIALLDSLNTGVPIGVTELVASSLGEMFREAAAFADTGGRTLDDSRRVTVHRVPWGPALLITPWNAPTALAAKKTANALAAGCPVILKPSQMAPFGAQVLAEIVASSVLAEDFQLVHASGASTAKYLADPRIRAVSMTGSTEVGREISKATAANFTRLRLELGSANPAIVLGDADIGATARELYRGVTKLNGQWCEAPRVVFVDRSVAGDLVEAVQNFAHSNTRVGSSLCRESTFGPLAFARRVAEIRQQLRKVADQIVSTHELVETPDAGSFFPPTLVRMERPDSFEEIFGPVLTVVPYENENDLEEALRYPGQGLAGYVFSEDHERAEALGIRLEAGEVKINGTSLLDLAPGSTQSFWGSSGIGEHGGLETFEFFRGSRIVGIDSPNPI